MRRRRRRKQLKLAGLLLAAAGAALVIHFVPIVVWYAALAVLAAVWVYLYFTEH